MKWVVAELHAHKQAEDCFSAEIMAWDKYSYLYYELNKVCLMEYGPPQIKLVWKVYTYNSDWWI